MFHGMEYVYEVYKEKSFSAAAQKLFISQPSLSATIKRIEKKLGYPIFDRSTKPLSLTEYGATYIQYVEKIMAAESEFQDHVNDWGDLKVGKLKIGGSSLFSSWVLPSLIARFSEDYPQIQVELVEESSANLENMLLDGKLDVILDNTVLRADSIDRHLFKQERLLLAVPENLLTEELPDTSRYQLALSSILDGSFVDNEIEAIPLKLLKGLPFLMLKPENDTRKRAMEVFARQNIRPKIRFELDQQLTSYNVSCSGMGISFISDTLIQSVPQSSDIVFFKPEKDCCQRNLYFYYKARRYVSKPMEVFLNMVSQS